MAKFIPISPTSLNVMKTCPRQFEAKYITKEVTFQESDATRWGSRVHKDMENYIKSGIAIPADTQFIQPYVDKFLSLGDTVLSETKLAIDEQGNPINWFNRHIGGIADVITFKGRHAFIGDLKTGKYRPDDTQLSILTKCLYATYPEVQTVSAALFFPHLGKLHSFNTQRETVRYTELDADVHFYEAVIERGEFKPKPNGLCRAWCDVLSCPHNGRK